MGTRRSKLRKVASKDVLLVASGDLRLSANRECWPAQKAMETELAKAVRACGFKLVRAHPVKRDEGHGFIGSQAEGMKVFRKIETKARLIVAEAVWQYSYHVLPGLTTHEGPILTVANWSGQWPGLVGMLNLNGSLTRVGVRYGTLWSEDFSDPRFLRKLDRWLKTGRVTHDLSHVKPLMKARVPATARTLGGKLAAELKRDKAIMGIFDEGCMGMYNAIIPDNTLADVGVFKERMSQSSLYYATMQVSDRDARRVFGWLKKRGMKFGFGSDEATQLTKRQVLMQCKMYIAATRLADDFGCECIGIQYQQGLKDLLPASDLVEGLLNESDRPPVKSADGKRVLFYGRPVINFNEVDECAGLDAIMTYRVHKALRQPVENTLHDVRWGDWDRSGTTDEYVWVLEISGSVPPSHLTDGYAGAVSERQPGMYFRLGGGTIKGISKPGEVVWSRIYLTGDKLNMDLGRGKAIELPERENLRRWNATTPQWPMMHLVMYGVTRDQFMAKHKANHIQVAYGTSTPRADAAMLAKAAMADAMGMTVNLCGNRKNGKAW